MSAGHEPFAVEHRGHDAPGQRALVFTEHAPAARQVYLLIKATCARQFQVVEETILHDRVPRLPVDDLHDASENRIAQGCAVTVGMAQGKELGCVRRCCGL